MTSLLTNTAAQTALATLTITNKNLSTVQTRISTGLRVSTAADNAAYWSIATAMRSDNAALSTVEDALGLGTATVDVAYTAINQTISVMKEYKKKLVAAIQPGMEREKIQSEIDELQAQLRGIASAAVFSGENWLMVDGTDPTWNVNKSIVSSFSRTGTDVTIGKVDVDTEGMVLFGTFDVTEGGATTTRYGLLSGERDLTTGTRLAGSSGFSIASAATSTSDPDYPGEAPAINISSLTDSEADLTTLRQYVRAVDVATAELTDAATSLGAIKARVDMQKTFVTALREAIDRGIGQLVDADMNEESTRLQALQVQAQLGIQALSIANVSSQNILALFK